MNNPKPFILIVSLLLLVIVSCSNDDDNNSNDTQSQINEIESTAANGTWRITNFNDSGQNETSDFAGYNFTFDANGTVTATNGNNTVTGTWSVSNDSNSNDDSSSDNDIDFNLFFPVSQDNDFEDLNDDWDVVSFTATKIDLSDDSGGNGGTDRLTFERN